MFVRLRRKNFARNCTLVGILLFMFIPRAWAIDLELTKGVKSKLPIAVINFSWLGDKKQAPMNIAQIVRTDLTNSGRFKVLETNNISQQPSQISDVDFKFWRSQQVNALLIGQVQSQGNNQYQVKYSLINLFRNQQQRVPKSSLSAALNPDNNPVIATKTITVNKQSLRENAHAIADVVYQDLLGEAGFFTRKIAYISLQNSLGQGGSQFNLDIADYDGFNAKSLLSSTQPLMSPSFSKDGRQLAYVSFESGLPVIYVMNMQASVRRAVAHYPGVDGAPAFSPDGKQLALALSKDGATNIYMLNLNTNHLQRITHDSFSDTSPAFSPDGQSLAFTSDRSGTPEIYQLNLSSQKITELTSNMGDYNADPTYSNDGALLAFTHQENNTSQIATLDLNTQDFNLLTNSQSNRSPTFSPNGFLILYSNGDNTARQLQMVSIDGLIHRGFPIQTGSQMEPAWGFK